MAEALKDQHWLDCNKSSKSLAKLMRGRKGRLPEINYKYLFTIDGEPIERFAELTHECKIIIISPYSRFSMLQGIEGFLDRDSVLRDREHTIRVMLKNRGASWYHQNLERARDRLS